MWGLRSGIMTPGRKNILAEKEEACTLAQEGLAEIMRLKGKMAEEEWKKHERSWKIAVKVSKALLAYNSVICAYFDAINKMESDPAALKETAEMAWEKITGEMADKNAPLPTLLSVLESWSQLHLPGFLGN